MSTILEQWRAGKGLPDVLVLDGHTHLGDWPHGANFRDAAEAVDGAVAIMDAYGVDAACVLSGSYWASGSDYRMGNDFLLDCTRRAPERLIPFAHVNPNDSLPAIIAELERVVGAGVHCLKLYNSYQAYPGDAPNLLAVYEFAQEHHMLMVNHYWSETELRTLAVRYPGAIFIRAHGGASGPANCPMSMTIFGPCGRWGASKRASSNMGQRKSSLAQMLS
jgi:predicted TIM-barrel fold metal-dependent hydrolase